MKKKIISSIIFVTVFLSFVLSYGSFPKIGGLAYHSIMKIESTLYGFTQSKVNIGELSLGLYKTKIDPSKPTLIMLHGYSADKTIWLRFARHFTNAYNVVIPDMAGHGESSFNKEMNHSAPAQAKRIIALMDTLNIKKAHITGNSMGGFIAAHIALSYPDRSLSAFLIDPTGVQSPKPSDMEIMLQSGRNPFEIETCLQFQEFYKMTMYSPPWVPSVILDFICERYQSKRLELRQILQEFYGKDTLDDSLHTMQPPVLLLWGEKDRLIHISSAEVWRSKVPNIQVEIWEGIGHMPMVEDNVRAAKLYKNFLSNIK
jgi:abhydrolase domain-containing protein 6